MDGTPTMKAVAAAALAFLALGGSIGPALAEDDAGIPTPEAPAAEATVELPGFVPSAEPEAGFTDAFAPFDDPAIAPAPAAPEGALGTVIGSGVASWYGREFAGRKTASGERFDPGQYTAAHRTLPFGSKVRVTHNGRSVVVRINDRGPFHGGRVIDLSQAAAEDLGIRHAGSGRVELALVEG
jgi:rare lipoprotein A